MDKRTLQIVKDYVIERLFTIDEETIRRIIADYYGVRPDDVCLFSDYKFVLKGDDKVREDFIYAIVEKSE